MRPKQNYETQQWEKLCKCALPKYRIAQNIIALSPVLVCGNCGRSFDESEQRKALAMMDAIYLRRRVEERKHKRFESKTKYIIE